MLRIEPLADSQVRISWPGALTGFTLQTTPALAPAQWTAEGTPPALVNGRNAVTNALGDAARFYRLIQ